MDTKLDTVKHKMTLGYALTDDYLRQELARTGMLQEKIRTVTLEYGDPLWAEIWTALGKPLKSVDIGLWRDGNCYRGDSACGGLIELAAPSAVEEVWAAWKPLREKYLEAEKEQIREQHEANLRFAEETRRAAAEKEERVAAESASRMAAIRDREDWIRAHGSKRLQRLAEEGIEYEAVYRDERLALERPGWHWETEEEDEYQGEPRNCREDELELLDTCRAIAGDAQLRWLAIPNDNEDQEDEDMYGRWSWRGYRCWAKFLGKWIVSDAGVEAE